MLNSIQFFNLYDFLRSSNSFKATDKEKAEWAALGRRREAAEKKEPKEEKEPNTSHTHGP